MMFKMGSPAAFGGGGFFRRRVIPPAAPGSGSRGGGPGLRPRLRVPGGRSGSRPRRRRGPGTRRGGGGRAWSRDFCVLIIGLKDSYDYTLIACFRVTWQQWLEQTKYRYCNNDSISVFEFFAQTYGSGAILNIQQWCFFKPTLPWIEQSTVRKSVGKWCPMIIR
jgi:hypothetical protein